MPKGVMVTHANLLYNLEMVRRAFGQTAESVVVGWLPLFHDMGLIGNVLEPCYVGSECVLMSPAAFLQKPSRWLEAIHRFRGTTSGGPNFAYDLCARSASPKVREGLDLSSWSIAFNGAEPVRAETLRRFSETFAPCGFRSSAFFPCYGLAEATLFVSGSPRRTEPHTTLFGVTALESGMAVPVVEGPGRELVSSGSTWMDQRIAVVDTESGTPCPERRVGEILIAGPSVAAGYWNQPEETEATFRARIEGENETYLRTGDLGFLAGGELFLTGRLKDLIILHGRNLYPHDLERTVECSHPALRAGCGAAFSIDEDAEERLVVVHEVERHPGDLGEIADAVSRAIAEEHGVRVADIVLLRAGTIPKTSSGKIRRRECRTRYLAGDLMALHQSTYPQDTAIPQDSRLLSRCDLLDLDPAERSATLMTWLRDEIARQAGVAADRLEPETMLVATGLDSLALFDLERRLEADLGFAQFGVPLSELSIAALRDRVLDALAEAQERGDAVRPALVRGEELGDHPLSPGQEALWFLEHSAIEEGVFHIAAAARLGNAVDSSALLRAALDLSARHPSLRTTFAASEGDLRQRVHASLPPDLGEVDATAWSAEELDGILRGEAKRRLDLAGGSPLRIRIFTRPHGERILLLVLHHLSGDFWSLAVLMRDWAVLYACERGERRPPLPDLAASYSDFVRWQRRLLANPERQRLERYWLDRLHGAPLVLGLPTDRPRPLNAGQQGALLDMRLDPDTTERVRELARTHGATLFTTLLAAFQILLGRLTGQEDLLVGSPTTGRRDRKLDGVIGYFVNPVPLRADLAGDPPLLEFLARTRRTVAGALEHRDFPFPELAQRLQPVRDPGRLPVFQTLFVLQQTAPWQEPGLSAFALGHPGVRIELEGLALESLRLDRGTAQTDLILFAAEFGDILVFSCEYDTALFDGTTVGRWLRHLQTLLNAAAARPEARLGELPLLTAAERHQILREWSDTAVSFPREATIYGLFAEQMKQRPAAVAVEQGSVRVTYGELQKRAEGVARRLVAQGLRPEERVAVLAERSPDLIAILVGILQAGGAYLPLDPTHPPERLIWMIRDAGASLLLASPSSSLAEIALPAELRLVTLEGEEPEADLPEVPAESLAYVMYTSGSTGTPKAVMVTHRNVVRLVRGADYAEMGPENSWLQYAPVSFDASTLEIWAPLLNGGRLVLFPGSIGSLDDLAWILKTHRVNSAWLTAGLFHEMVNARQDGLQPLNQLLAGGDVVSPEHARRILETSANLVLINGYGPTEGTTFSCCYRMTDPQQVGESVPIGRPIANAQVYVLDERLVPVPVGARGELYIGGGGLARGYLDRPDLTAERFVPNPLAAEKEDPGGRLYRTGDLVRCLPDGRLEFLGRIDHQVKIRGFRIEIGEIEAILGALAGVQEAVVVAREDIPGDKRLVAYVVCDSPVETLHQWLRERLPDYMVPSALVKLAGLPLTSNGKVDRKALPTPEWQSTAEGYVAPRTQVEEILTSLWAELLEVDRIGVHDNFFSLGGHSLKASRLVARIRETFAVELPLRIVFGAPTVESLADAITCERGDMAVPTAKIPLIDRFAGRFPLSFAQEQLWFLDRMRPGLAAYNLPSALRFQGLLSVEALTWGLTEVVRRHEALRTRFEVHGGAPVQVVISPAPFSLPVVDLSGLDALYRDCEVRRLAVAETMRPFDLGSGCLIRAGLLRLGAEEHVLLIALHHIGADAWSLGLFVRELAALYTAFQLGQPAGLPEPAVQFVDFAVWQRQRLQGETLERLLSFWCDRLEGSVSPLDLPVDRVRPPVPSYRGARLPLTIPPELTTRLTTLARRAGATPFMAMFAALAVLLYRYTDRERLALGSPVASRGARELEGTIGLLLNTMVFPFDFAAEISFLTLLERTRDLVLDAFAHQDLPFPVLVEALQPERDLSRNPLFQVFFAQQSEAAPVLELPGLVSQPVDFDPGTAQFDLALNLSESKGGWSGWLEYSTDLFDTATVHRVVGHLLELVRGLITEPECRVSELPLLSVGEWDQLSALSWTAACEFDETTIHERIEARVDLEPEAQAVLYADRALSYAELDRRANRLARRLLKLGAGPGHRVALCVRRSAEMVAAMLGILKSGSAYIPMDPEYPGERLTFMLEDASPVAVVMDETTAAILPPHPLPVVRLDDPGLEEESHRRPAVPTAADDLAYVIYTSGSTGRPKGVMISHRNLVSFFSGVDRRFGAPSSTETCLASTSISFDISVLELLWPLTRGARVAVHGDRQRITNVSSAQGPRPAVSSRRMAFSLFYFADDEPGGSDKYRLLLEGARFADEHGFEAVWTPERHFHSFGGLYPNPSITSAAVAAVTQRVGIRAGSLVLPLHDPIRVAEDWSMVDNLSGGRVGVSFASGWHGNDFVFAPHQYSDRRQILYRDLETVRALWRGETVSRPGGEGMPVEVCIRPLPVQPELPVWITAAENPDTFRQAGEIGANLLTHLLGQTLEELAEKIAIYRRALRENGHTGAGRVTLMLHTFVGEHLDEVRELVAEPFRRYLRSSVGLLANHARNLGMSGRLDDLSEEDMSALLDHAFERYFRDGALVGTPTTCLKMVEKVNEIGVDEVACLIDFGVPVDLALAALHSLAELSRQANAAEEPQLKTAEPTIAEAIRRHRASWLQATPSMARMLASDPEALSALSGLRRLLLGGEALPEDLAFSLRQALPKVELHNMYGPTETTVWSTAQQVDEVRGIVPIGEPLGGEWALVLSRSFQPLPAGVPGELYLGGAGVARGYHERAALTAERFIPDPFAPQPGARLYRTGDLVRRRPDGVLEFLGRVDHQVKVRGHRIEPGEIEVLLCQHPQVAQAVVVARPDASGEASLAAYLVPRQESGGWRSLFPVPEAAELLAGRRQYQLPNGLTVAHLSGYQTADAYREIFRDHDYLRHGIRLEDEACIFDVGANIGLFSLFVHQACRDPRVYAFEPIPSTFDVLRTNVALYGLNVTLFNHGIAERPACAEFTFYPNAPGMSGRFATSAEDHCMQRAIFRSWLEETGAAATAPSSVELDALLADWFRAETVVCQVRTLSEVIAESGVERIDLLKIDAESSEVDVLLGLTAADWPKIRQVVAEVHSPELLAGMRAMLEPRGFEIATDDVALVREGEDGRPIHVFMLYAILREDGGVSRAGAPQPTAASVSISTPALRSWLRERLPDFMIPAAFVTLDALPLTPNGKIDRQALPTVDGRRPELDVSYVAPSSTVEERIAGIWQEVLGLDRVGRYDNFFELGGSSLSLVQVRSALSNAFGTSAISLVDMFRNPTVASLAARVTSSGDARVALDEVEDRGRQQADALRQGASAVQRQRDFLAERRQRREIRR